MPEALSLANEKLGGEPATVLEAALSLGITVVVSASILQSRLARGLPDEVRKRLGSLETDAQTAIQFVRSTPGISTALVGMSRVEHVEENLSLIDKEPLGAGDFGALWQ
jgi:predicted aldo/keto reductase-like oxidoreductase